MTAAVPAGVPAARPVRPEDAFDVPRVAAWLAARIPDLQSDPPPDPQPGAQPGAHGLPEVLQFRGGASNLTYLLRFPGRDVVLRRPPHGTRVAGAHDVVREARVLSRLRPHFPAVPAVLAVDETGEVLGAPCAVVEHVSGLVLRAERPDGLALAPDAARALGLGAFDLLADLHAVDLDVAGLRDLGPGAGYVRRQVDGWSRRYRAARTDDVPDGAAVTAWLDRAAPPDSGLALVHGDWRLDNLVLDPDDLSTVRAVLDWEMATVGDPLVDLGAALAYWVQADDDPLFALLRRQPSHLPGMPTRDEVVAAYAARSGRDVSPDTQAWLFYEVFGLFRLAVVVQQIWVRYRSGATSDPAFQHFGGAVQVLLDRCGALTSS